MRRETCRFDGQEDEGEGAKAQEAYLAAGRMHLSGRGAWCLRKTKECNVRTDSIIFVNDMILKDKDFPIERHTYFVVASSKNALRGPLTAVAMLMSDRTVRIGRQKPLRRKRWHITAG